MSFGVNGGDPISSLRNLAMTVAGENVFRAFGAPSRNLVEIALFKEPSLVALHLAAAFYKMAVVSEVLEHYASHERLAIEDFPVLSMLVNGLQGRHARVEAKALYGFAVKLAPNLAEAHYGLARLLQAGSNWEAALVGFEKVLSLSPHREAPAHAFLHANARWESGTLLEGQGRDHEALLSYRAALAELGTFGVHHIRFARFLRRLGRVEEAAVHYRHCMSYTHRYFPEFILPPLTTSDIPVPPPIDVIYSTQRGEAIIFWNGVYVAIDGRDWSPDLTNTQELDRRLASGLSHRKANSIAALEDGLA
jgi:tetratricopeptide (TPR) repeat protein